MKIPVQITLFESEKQPSKVEMGTMLDFTEGMTASQMKNAVKTKIEGSGKITVTGPVKLFLNRKELQDTDVLEFTDGGAYNCKIYKA